MTHSTHFVGVDPGLVHTGCVSIGIFPDLREVRIDHEAVVGPDAAAVLNWIDGRTSHVYIEGYRPRSNFGTDTRMIAAVSEMHKAIKGSTVLLNTGVKKVVKQPLMELLGVWKFATPTNHDDLRSAARIALLGMLKSEPHNRLLTTVVLDHLDGRPWDVHR